MVKIQNAIFPVLKSRKALKLQSNIPPRPSCQKEHIYEEWYNKKQSECFQKLLNEERILSRTLVQ
jgi:hypothetical protein